MGQLPLSGRDRPVLIDVILGCALGGVESVTFNNARQRRDDAIRKSHQLMQSWDDFIVGKDGV